MTEEQWLSCHSPEVMLRQVRERSSHRKLRLFGVACCRRITGMFEGDVWPTISAGVNAVLDEAEKIAEGLTGVDELGQKKFSLIGDVGYPLTSLASYLLNRDVWLASASASAEAADLLTHRVETTMEAPLPRNRAAKYFHAADEKRVQATIVRDIFGNPFCPIVIDPDWQSWRDGTVVKVAQAAYDKRELPSGQLDPGRLAILGDALEESGCAERALLEHLRQTKQPHVRGCWAVDLLLGKE